jgi:CheY-like chemotaxis protein
VDASRLDHPVTGTLPLPGSEMALRMDASTVSVVDDQCNGGELLAMLLEQCGADVQCASAQAVLDALRLGEAHLLVGSSPHAHGMTRIRAKRRSSRRPV